MIRPQPCTWFEIVVGRDDAFIVLEALAAAGCIEVEWHQADETQPTLPQDLLKEFNAYLRATLPMFEREQQSLREELDLVRHYLAIMQARMGERLQWTVQTEPGLAELVLPPGSLLTLVENAITHGIEPSLRGGRIEVQVQREAALARVVVADSGAGLDCPPDEGLGLSNTRERLLDLHPGARLQLQANEDGGCTATMEIPCP